MTTMSLPFKSAYMPPLNDPYGLDDLEDVELALTEGEWFRFNPNQPRDKEGQWTAYKRASTSLTVESIERTYGQGVDRLFPNGAQQVPTPWPRVARRKGEQVYDPELVKEALRRPPQLERVDTRILHSTQPSVVRQHVDYYLTDEYKLTGRTSADQNNAANFFPIIYVNRRGEHIILSGHHRAAAQLTRGEDLDAIVVRESQP